MSCHLFISRTLSTQHVNHPGLLWAPDAMLQYSLLSPVSDLCSAFRSGPSLSKPLSKKELLQRQLSEGDMDLDDVAARSTTATPGPSDDDMPSELFCEHLAMCKAASNMQCIMIVSSKGHTGFLTMSSAIAGPGRSGNVSDEEAGISSSDDRGNNASDVELSD